MSKGEAMSEMNGVLRAVILTVQERDDLRAKLKAAEAENAQLALAYATPCDPAFNNWIEEAEWLRGEVARLNTRVAQADKIIYDTNELEELYDKLSRDYCLVRDSRDELIKDYAEWMSPEDYVPLAQERDALRAEVARLKGITPELPPCPPMGAGMPRYGVRWNGPTEPLAVPMDDGYWTPWHLADRLQAEVARLREALVNIGQARIVNSTELQRIARAAIGEGK